MRRLKVGDKVLRVRDEGETPRGARRPPLVCVHGAGASSVVWMETVRRLSATRRVVAIDLPGHGQSDPWHETQDLIGLYRDAVGTACKLLGVDQAVLVGHSMGGQVALAAAAAWPDKVAGLVLVASAPRIAVAPALLSTLETRANEAAAWLRPLLFSPASPPELADQWMGLLTAAEPATTVADFRAVAGFDGGALAERLSLPTLVLGGDDDVMTPPAALRALARAVRGAGLVLLPDCGHMVMLEQPTAFFDAVQAFLTTL